MVDITLREAPLRFTSSLGESDAARAADTLNLLPYAEALRDFIQSCETETTIGIQGEWGIGRTSLMNMLRGSSDSEQCGLLDPARCKAVSLDSWPYAQFDARGGMAVNCLVALTRQLGEVLSSEPSVDQDTLQRCLVEANGRLALVAARLGASPVAEANPDNADYTDLPGEMLAFRRAFAGIVSSWAGGDPSRRVVIFIDDLDRIRPLRAIELLEAVKNFVDVPGCVFVMSLDYRVVQAGMVEKFGKDIQKTSGKAFFDKIVQLPFSMPTTSYELDEFITQLLFKAGFPCLQDGTCDDESRRFFLDITRFTVGRNPRSIKRVVNSAQLLERINALGTGRDTTDTECKILFALVSMQVAWPELFEFFLRDPSQDTITSLQNWSFLDGLPEAASLFDRSPDRELVKSSISAYFDTLFALLDKNDDGQIDSRELEPVLEVMETAKMTSIESRERKREWIVRRIQENNIENSPLIDSFLKNVFMKSVWYMGTEIKYRRAGHRYVTLVHDRRQIGTLVTLRSQPLVFRLAMAPERVMTALKERWDNKLSVKKEAIVLVRNTFGSEASLTGFGDTLVDFSKLTYLPSKEAVKLLNLLYHIVTEHEPQPGA